LAEKANTLERFSEFYVMWNRPLPFQHGTRREKQGEVTFRWFITGFSKACSNVKSVFPSRAALPQKSQGLFQNVTGFLTTDRLFQGLFHSITSFRTPMGLSFTSHN
jgi:hypothetical protein